MKKFDELNYYEVLEISFDASAFEVEIAYKNALSMYNEDSLLTYSLFMNDERENVLKKVEEAYYTLNDTSRREAYNATLRINPVLSNDQTQTDKNSRSFYNDDNNIGDAIKIADDVFKLSQEKKYNLGAFIHGLIFALEYAQHSYRIPQQQMATIKRDCRKYFKDIDTIKLIIESFPMFVRTELFFCFLKTTPMIKNNFSKYINF